MARRSARKAAAEETGQPELAAVELDTPADPEAAERARAVQTAEDAAAAEEAAAEESAEAGVPATGDDGAEGDGVGGTEAQDGTATAKEGSEQHSDAEAEAAKPAKRRRAPKLDALLAADIDVARKALLEVAPEDQIGEHAGVKAEDDRVVTHLFESYLPGYNGWQWFAVLTRVPRGKVATVSEVGLLPSERSVLAPEWVPWAKRIRPEEKQQAEADQAQEDANNKQESQSADK
ncbi:DUF3027 domain-containing protein [Arthrobacter monumenti]